MPAAIRRLPARPWGDAIDCGELMHPVDVHGHAARAETGVMPWVQALLKKML